MNNDWAFDLEERVFTIVKNKGKGLLTQKYPKIVFTQTNLPLNTDNNYPTVYIHQIASAESGLDITGSSINAVVQSFQVEVYSNTSQADCKKVMKVIANIFKDMYFSATYMPEIDNQLTTYRSVARFRRLVGGGDKF